MAGRTARATGSARNLATRELILDAAERLFAEQGIAAVSNRQVGEAAGQGNTAVVGYHFGSKVELVRAVVRRHNEQIEPAREQMLLAMGPERGVREWVACLVLPNSRHLARLGTPSWHARFSAQVLTDPLLRSIYTEEAVDSPALQRIVTGLGTCLAVLPAAVRAERGDISRHLLVHMFADRERALAEGTRTPHATWQDAAEGLIDAMVGLWTAPVSGSSARVCG